MLRHELETWIVGVESLELLIMQLHFLEVFVFVPLELLLARRVEWLLFELDVSGSVIAEMYLPHVEVHFVLVVRADLLGKAVIGDDEAYVSTVVAQNLHDRHFQILEHLTHILGLLNHRRYSLSDHVLRFTRQSGLAKDLPHNVLLLHVGLEALRHNLNKGILLV